MALTESKLKDLEDKLFDELYEGDKADWDALAESARLHAKDFITNGAEPRPDDIAKVLFPMMQVNDDLRKHQEEHSARAKRWVEWFVDYVIDQAIVNTQQGGNDAGQGQAVDG